MTKVLENLRFILPMIICFIFIDTTPLYADGKVFGGMDFTSLHPVDENMQKAAIVHQDNLQKMIIAVNFKLADSEKALWILPVPGTPEKVDIEITDKFPEFYGSDVRAYASANIAILFAAVRATQVYTLPLMLRSCVKSARLSDVSLIKQVDKWGIHVETISAHSLDGFFEYLNKKKVGIDRKELIEFEPYLSDKYILVLTWISSRTQLLQEFPEYQNSDKRHNDRWPCLYVEFPTQKVFYPLRPTSGYGKKPMKVLLYIVGSVKPEISSPLSKYITRKYFHKNKTPSVHERFIENLSSENTPYTRITLESPADSFTEDLWFSYIPVPWGVRYAAILEGLPIISFWILLIFLTALLSYVSAGITGLILFRQWKGYAKIGLFNLFSIIALLASAFSRSEKHIWPFQKSFKPMLFVIIFSFVFIVLSIILEIIMQYPLLDSFSNHIYFPRSLKN